VGAGHAHRLYRPGDTVLHRLPPECKLAATFLFVVAVVATPREAFWAYGVYAAAVLVLARVARIPLGGLLRRLVIELPFVAFAFFLPFVSHGERVDVLGVSLSVDGLWAAWNILVKGTLGVAASVVMAGTTEVTEVLRGLERLRVPRSLTAIAGFMVRYGEVITDEMQRMKVARISRGYDPRWFWQTRAVASSAATLFIRSYERGERVYLAMVSRGWTGAFPAREARPPDRRAWGASLALPLGAACVSTAAWALR
jgi:cobalt/nickel transport system permease protein